MYNRTEDKLLRFKRILALIVSLGMAALSVNYSKNGFGIESNEQVLWIGWFLGITVNVIEMVFNTNVRNLNPTLIVAGVIAYAYGLWTNITGFHGIMNSWGFSVIVGVLVEVLPEPLFAWAIGVTSGGDVIGNLGELMGFGGYPVQSKSVFHNQPVGFHRPEPYKPNLPKKQVHKFPSESLIYDEENDGKLKSPLFDETYVRRHLLKKNKK